ncbi:hypothetical protein M8818_000814 [Zalaria obscura]|uniref:Uncharacterized protein n=1 Tax=Zalaria obscura TaxID=2024903 RepID=A0ACC3SMX2_9PEZI
MLDQDAGLNGFHMFCLSPAESYFQARANKSYSISSILKTKVHASGEQDKCHALGSVSNPSTFARQMGKPIDPDEQLERGQ